MDKRVLFVGGTWDLNGGKKSKLVNSFSEEIENVTIYNGGDYKDLERIIEMAKNYDIVFWWANVDNSLPKVRNIKEINYRVMLVSSKRNDNYKYSDEQLLQRSLGMKANLTVEFSKTDGNFKMRVFDPLGNIWYEGYDIKKCALNIFNRLESLVKYTRKSTISE